MAIAGALIGKAIGAFGSKPKIPELPPIDPTKVQADTIAGNQANLAGIKQTGAEVNEFNVAQRLGMLKQALAAAGAGGALEQAGGNIMSQLRGEIPADVAQQIQRNSASMALAGGFGGGSVLGRNLTARDFGLTSMSLMQQGMANFGNFSSMITPQQFDVTSMFFSPQQRLEFAFNDRSARFQRDLLAAQVKAAPDPATAAIGREVDRFFNTAAQVGMMAGGNTGGGGGMMGGMMG